jgi:glycosyltransferase involved in cell wall biosynthesis
MNTLPLLSIVTICFRNPADLHRTLATLTDMPADVEILVIDGSPDDSCAKIVAGFQGVRHLQQRDDGKYDAMNKGIEAANGDALLFLNSGDELASAPALIRLLERHGAQLSETIVYGDCKHRTAGRDIHVKAPLPEGENLRLGRLPSHQSTLIPRGYHRNHLYDATMFFAADTQFLKRAYRELPAIHFPEAIGIFEHGGASTSPGSSALLIKQYRELSQAHELSFKERTSIAFLLFRRKLLHMVFGEARLQRMQAWRLAAREKAGS